MRLDLGCGMNVRPGFEGVDLNPGPGVLHVVDLSSAPWTCEGMPHGRHGFHTGTVDELHSSHFVEHVPDLAAFMNEAHRVLVPGGRFTIRHPYAFSAGADCDPTHRRALNEASWLYYNRAWRRAQGLELYLGITADFEIGEPEPIVSDEFEGWEGDRLVFAMRHYVNVITELTVELTKI